MTRKLITCLPQAGIHQNPVEEGLVFKAEDYVYSSAIDYVDIPVILTPHSGDIDPPLILGFGMTDI